MVLLDNDVLLKVSCYAVVDEALSCLSQAAGAMFALGVARFVLSKRISRSPKIADKAAAAAALARFIAAISQLEPDDDEVLLATEFEAEAQKRGLALDTGESLLVAALIKRSASLMLTGDKRAVHAVDQVAAVLDWVQKIAGRVACLEQLFMTLVERYGVHELHMRVCSVQRTHYGSCPCNLLFMYYAAIHFGDRRPGPWQLHWRGSSGRAHRFDRIR